MDEIIFEYICIFKGYCKKNLKRLEKNNRTTPEKQKIWRKDESTEENWIFIQDKSCLENDLNASNE